jgi:hypothetical protein
MDAVPFQTERAKSARVGNIELLLIAHSLFCGGFAEVEAFSQNSLVQAEMGHLKSLNSRVPIHTDDLSWIF